MNLSRLLLYVRLARVLDRFWRQQMNGKTHGITTLQNTRVLPRQTVCRSFIMSPLCIKTSLCYSFLHFPSVSTTFWAGQNTTVKHDTFDKTGPDHTTTQHTTPNHPTPHHTTLHHTTPDQPKPDANNPRENSILSSNCVAKVYPNSARATRLIANTDFDMLSSKPPLILKF